MSEWQPIDTAPKDGSYIWLYLPGHQRLGFWSKGEEWEHHGSVGGGWRDLAKSEGCGPDDFDGAPTHWMPVPSPPEQSN